MSLLIRMKRVTFFALIFSASQVCAEFEYSYSNPLTLFFPNDSSNVFYPSTTLHASFVVANELAANLSDQDLRTLVLSYSIGATGGVPLTESNSTLVDLTVTTDANGDMVFGWDMVVQTGGPVGADVSIARTRNETNGFQDLHNQDMLCNVDSDPNDGICNGIGFGTDSSQAGANTNSGGPGSWTKSQIGTPAMFDVVATVTGGNGSVVCAPTSVTSGGSSTCTASPDSGFQVSAWTGDCASAGASNTCNLTNILADQSSTVSFEAIPVTMYSVTASVTGGNGSVACTPTSVASGGSSTCTASPDSGFQVSAWTGDCASAGISNVCNLTNVMADQSSIVSFEAIPVTMFSVTASVTGGNGSVACTPDSVASGGSSTCTAAPDSGFQVSAWTGDCASAGISNACNLTNVMADQSSTVSFEMAAVTTFTGALPSGATGTLSFTTTDTGCTFATPPQFLDTVSPPPPASVFLVDGVISFAITGCLPGATVTLQMDYGSNLPIGSNYWKAGTPWYRLPASIDNNSGVVTFSITDGGNGDTDGTVNGSIVDPGGVATGDITLPPTPPATPSRPIPTMSAYGLVITALGLLFVGYRRLRLSAKRH